MSYLSAWSRKQRALRGEEPRKGEELAFAAIRATEGLGRFNEAWLRAYRRRV